MKIIFAELLLLMDSLFVDFVHITVVLNPPLLYFSVFLGHTSNFLNAIRADGRVLCRVTTKNHFAGSILLLDTIYSNINTTTKLLTTPEPAEPVSFGRGGQQARHTPVRLCSISRCRSVTILTTCFT